MNKNLLSDLRGVYYYKTVNNELLKEYIILYETPEEL